MADSLFTFVAPTSYGQSTTVSIATGYDTHYGYYGGTETISYGSVDIDPWDIMYMHPVILYFSSGNYSYDGSKPSMANSCAEPYCGRTLEPSDTAKYLIYKETSAKYGILYIKASSSRIEIYVTAASNNIYHGWAINLLMPMFLM